MEYFAGLDVSVKDTSVCIVDDTGKIVREVKVTSEPEALLAVLCNPAYHFKRIGLEAGPLSQWLFSELAEADLPMICVETRHMRAVLKAQIDVPARFRKSKSVGAVFGLTPARDQSGERDYPGAISRCGDEMMRTTLYEAAQIMLMHSAKWSWLKAWAMKIARHRGRKKAVVALARRLAVIMHRIWVDGTEFKWTREAVAA
jgi:transposase